MFERLAMFVAVFIALSAAALLTAGCEKPAVQNRAQDVVVNEPQPATADAAQPVETRESSAEPEGNAAVRQDAAPTTKVVAYYFHRTMRCDACLTIEAQAEEAVLGNFVDALEQGRLEWQPLNIEEPGNEHFEDDFELTRQSVVVMEIVDGQVTRWKNLERVWDLLDDPAAFADYIVEEVAELLGG